MQLAAAWQAKDGVTRVPLYLEPAESVFVVFRPEPRGLDPVVAMTHDGRAFPPAPPKAVKAAVVKGSYVVQSATYGVPGDAARTRDVKSAVQRAAGRGRDVF